LSGIPQIKIFFSKAVFAGGVLEAGLKNRFLSSLLPLFFKSNHYNDQSQHNERTDKLGQFHGN